MRQIETSSLSNQNIATALLVHTHTTTADRLLSIRVALDQVAGNGSYSCYATVQRLGAGSNYEVQPRTAATVASGVTSIMFVTFGFPVQNTDVVKVYVLGLAGDTTTPDIITGIWEDDSLRPTTADRTLDVTATGEAGIDWANVGSPTTTLALTGTTSGLIDNAITAAKIATDAIDADAIADGAITSGVFAAGAINAASIAADAITDAKVASDVTIASVTGAVGSVTAGVTLANNAVTAAAVAADAVTEIQSGLATLAAIFAYDLESGKTFAQAILDLWAKENGNSVANDAVSPTSATYDSPDGTVQVEHTHTPTSRTKV